MPTKPVRLDKEVVVKISTNETSTVQISETTPDKTLSPLMSRISLAENRAVTIGPFIDTRTYIADETGDITYEYTSEKLQYNHQATGILNGGLLSVNQSDPKKFDIAEGSGVIVDNYTDPSNPTTVKIEWDTLEGLTPTFLPVAIISFVGIDAGGNVIQFVGLIDDESRRDYIIIGILIHTSNTVVEGAAFLPYPAYDEAHAFIDFNDTIGPVNKLGNKFTGNSDMELEKSAGQLFRIGINWAESQKTPNVKDIPQEDAPNFFLSYQDGSGGFKGFERSTEIDPSVYDNGSGTLGSLPLFQRWQIMRIYLASNNDVIVSPGQNTYRNRNQALAAINVETFNKNPVLKDTNLRGFLVIRNNCNDLSNTNRCEFVEADKFGQVAAEGSAPNIPIALQQFDNSPKDSNFTAEFNTGYVIDNTTNAVQVTLPDASEDAIGCFVDFWILADTSAKSVSFRGYADTDTINGVTGTVGSPAVASYTSGGMTYMYIKVTTVADNTYFITAPDSVST